MKIKVGDKDITIRKWKGKDKKNFIKALNTTEINESLIMETLVYSCIEEDVILSTQEFRYVLSKIRAYSLGENIDIDFYCEACGEVHNESFNINEIIKYTFEPLNEIKVKDVHIKLGDIKNKEKYIELINEDALYDLLLRVESFNGNDAFTLDDLIDMFDDLDIDVLTEILEIYESKKFTIDDKNEVQCPACKDTQVYHFDELPGFFPSSWFE